MPLPSHSVDEGVMFFMFIRPPCVSRQILLPCYLMNGLSYISDTCREYSPAPIDEPQIRFWRSNVRRVAECMHVDTGASKSIL